MAVAVGRRTRWAAAAMIVFLIVITPIFHAFWAAAPDQVRMQNINFMKDLSIPGGMLVLWAAGPGRCRRVESGRRAHGVRLMQLDRL